MNLNAARRDQAQTLYELFLDWLPLYPKSSLREFITWQGQGEYQARLYAYVFAGLALHSKLAWPELRLGDLDTMGRLIWAGKTEAEVKALYESGGMDAVRAGTTSRDTTNLKIPMASAAEARQIIAGVSDSDKLAAPEAAALIISAFGHADPVIQNALLHAERTGENPLDALITAADARRDYRLWLSGRPCAVPACGVRPVELHHLKAGQHARFRSNDVLLPLCTRHHQAQPGNTPAAHAANQDAWATTHFGSVVALWQHVALQLTEWAEAQRGSADE